MNPGRGPSPAEIQNLRIQARAGNKLAQHALSVLDQMNAGGVPLGVDAAPPGMKRVDMSTAKIHPLPCGACGSEYFEKMVLAKGCYNENDPSHQWMGMPVEVILCAKCGSEHVQTEIRKQSSDPSEPEVRYEHSTRTFKVGIQQIQQILAEQRVQMVNQVADILDEHFGTAREAEAEALMLKIGSAFGLERKKEGEGAAPEPAPEPKPVPQAAPKSSIITEV